MTKVRAAVLDRARRSTAGKRLSSLVGKALEDDDAFWSHSIWSEAGGGFADDKRSRKRQRGEDGGSSSSSSGSENGSGDDRSSSDGEASYRMSDDDPGMAVDRFDSDFDESESEDEEEEGEGEEEQELRAEERREAASRRRKNQRLGVPLKSSAGRELMKRKSGKMKKRGPLGEGWNEGLVLNWPPPSGQVSPAGAIPGVAAPIPTQKLNCKSATIPSAQGASSIPPSTPPKPPIPKPRHISVKPIIDLTQTSKLRFPPSPKRNLRTTLASMTAAKPVPKRLTSAASKASKRRHYTQEELLLESIQSTEAANAKWLSSRKRGREEAARLEKAAADGVSEKASDRLACRFHSRRGCCNTLTFVDMDRLPEILTRTHASPIGGNASPSCTASKRRRMDGVKSEPSASPRSTADDNRAKCVVTGKVARYRDPETLLRYHDVDAYGELQRRIGTGKLIVPRRTSTRSNNRVSSPWSSDVANARLQSNDARFPFVADQPTMVAKVNKTNGISVKVMVTQGGVPVSPPLSTSAKILKFLSGRRTSSTSQYPSATEGFQYNNRKEPTPLHRFPPLVDAKNNGHGKVDGGGGGKANNGDAPDRVKSTPPKPAGELQNRRYQSGQSIEQSHIMPGAAGSNADDNRKDGGVQPPVAASSNAATTAAMMTEIEGKVEIAHGGSNAKAKSPPPVKDVSETEEGKGIVPERTTSNGKRTAIEAKG